MSSFYVSDFIFILSSFIHSTSFADDLPTFMRVESKLKERAMWYASLTNHMGSWQLVGHLYEDRNEGTAPQGPGCSKTSSGRVALDIHGFLRTICNLERIRQEESVKRRFRHYLNVIEEEDRIELATIGNQMNGDRTYY